MSASFKFCLYVTGDSVFGHRAKRNLTAICEEFTPGDYEIAVIDIAAEPHRARELKVVACPLLVRERPTPEQRVIGDLSDTATLTTILGLTERGRARASTETKEGDSR